MAYYKLVAWALLALWSLVTHAGEISVQPPTQLGEPRERIVPQEGGWWNPAEAGSGYFLKFLTNEDNSITGFATIYTYNADGTSTFLVVQGPVVFSTEAQRVDSGVVARFSSPLYKAANGQPFGGAYRPAEVTVAGLGDGEFVFFTRRRGEFRSGGRTVPIRVLSPLQAEQEYVKMLSGTWRIQGRLRMPSNWNASAVGFERTFSHVVRIELSSIQPSWRPSDRAATLLGPSVLRRFWQPPEGPNGVLTFTVRCAAECPPVPHPLGRESNMLTAVSGSRIWVDVATGRAGFVTAAQPFGSDPTIAYWVTAEQPFLIPNAFPNFEGGINWTFDLFLGETDAVGRGYVISTVSFAMPVVEQNSEMVMTKIDANTVPPGATIY